MSRSLFAFSILSFALSIPFSMVMLFFFSCFFFVLISIYFLRRYVSIFLSIFCPQIVDGSNLVIICNGFFCLVIFFMTPRDQSISSCFVCSEPCDYSTGFSYRRISLSVTNLRLFGNLLTSISSLNLSVSLKRGSLQLFCNSSIILPFDPSNFSFLNDLLDSFAGFVSLPIIIMNAKQSRFAKLGKALLNNSNVEVFHSILNSNDGRKRVDRLREFSEEVEMSSRYDRKIRAMRERIQSERLENQRMKRFIEMQLQQSERKILESNFSLAESINRQFQSLQSRQSKLEEAVLEIGRSIPPEAHSSQDPFKKDRQNKQPQRRDQRSSQKDNQYLKGPRYSEGSNRNHTKSELGQINQEPKRLQYGQPKTKERIKRSETTAKDMKEIAPQIPPNQKNSEILNAQRQSQSNNRKQQLVVPKQNIFNKQALQQFRSTMQNAQPLPSQKTQRSKYSRYSNKSKISQGLRQPDPNKSRYKQIARINTNQSNDIQQLQPQQKIHANNMQRIKNEERVNYPQSRERLTKARQTVQSKNSQQKYGVFTPKSSKLPQVLKSLTPKLKSKPRSLKKYFLAVYYLILLQKQMRIKIYARKKKSEAYFEVNYNKIVYKIGGGFHQLFDQVKHRMMNFQSKKPSFLSTKECYKQILKLLVAIANKLPQSKGMFTTDDPIISTFLTLLLSYNAFIPSGYLTKYELSAVQFSLSFGFLYKTQQMEVFLVSSFLLMRCILQNTLCQTQFFQEAFTKNEVVSGMLRHLIDAFYQLSKQIVQDYRQEVKSGGNWEELPSQLIYIPAEPVTIQILKSCEKWDPLLLQDLKADPLWKKLQFKIKEWIEDIVEYIYQHGT